MIQSAAIIFGLTTLSITSESLQLDADGFDEAGVTWDRQTAGSPFVHGKIEVGRIQGNGTLTGKVWCLGSTSAGVRTARDTLIAAVSNYAYTVSQTVDGATDSWECYAADYVIGNQSRYVRGLVIPVNLSIPYLPPLADV